MSSQPFEKEICFPGAIVQSGGVHFRVWAPRVSRMELKIFNGDSPSVYAMKKDAEGYFNYLSQEAFPGSLYQYILEGERERPDPVSYLQYDTVHGPSQVYDHEAFTWMDKNWNGLDLKNYILYELHAGTFTASGTLESAIARFPYLKELGITCIEIMPVAQFPGKRNWGYDGVFLYAVQNSYGGPDSLKKLVDAAHAAGLAVCLDVVYNHLGPEGNYLREFGPYFTDRYQTPWGEAVNYDGEDSREVRDFIIQNAVYWVRHFHVDALRLDAIHGIFDQSEKHLLAELKERVQNEAQRQGRPVYVIAESDLNLPKIVEPPSSGGYGLDSQWTDDFHHAVHRTLTGEINGYYADFDGIGDIVKALRDGFVYEGQYSKFRGREHGVPASHLPGEKFVFCIQNHDQVGNRARGDRLSQLISFEKLKWAAALLLSSPYIPLIFMGQEYGETAPFQYFIDHGDPGLIEAVRQGRQREFQSFGWQKTADPAAPETFEQAKLNWALTAKNSEHAFLYRLYRDLITLRKDYDLISETGRNNFQIDHREGDGHFLIRYQCKTKNKTLVAAFSLAGQPLTLNHPFLENSWTVVLDTGDVVYGGSEKRNRLKERNALYVLEPSNAVFFETHR
ncbi:MAG: malto-oligosyltrehalose trehalohydrolase [Candidatus Omnitrophica bacterium]|nr:malto-oligosyltrehalose trehalohydrolase [Candidatus Omnitrophota bacterium]